MAAFLSNLDKTEFVTENLDEFLTINRSEMGQLVAAALLSSDCGEFSFCFFFKSG